MNIGDVFIRDNSVQTAAPNATSVQAGQVPSSSPMPSTMPSFSVSISGQALVRQRLFHCDNPNVRLPLATGFNGYINMKPMVNFLTEKDRQVLAEVYEFAQTQGADLRYVDSLGCNLAHYREKDSGRGAYSLNAGNHFDPEGHRASFAFTAKDTVTANRILASEEIKTTRLDHGFLRFELNKDYSAIGHGDFEFLEQVVNKFSVKGEGSLTENKKFSKLEVEKDNVVITHSKEVYEHLAGERSRIKGSAGGKVKGSKPQPAPMPVPPETLRQTLRRLMFQALGNSFGGRVVSLAEFLLKSGR